jgi:ATP-dependent exoDNAse (exonuclease V) beta subunit
MAKDSRSPDAVRTGGAASVILASAGSGKTFELAGRYIGALDRSGGAPDRILATTFTRKAAGEMLAKVLDRLIGTSKGLDGAGVGLGIDAKRARELALGLVRQIDRVRVQTLDSYFAEIGRFGAGELGLTPGWRILDEVEVDEAREQAIDLLCQRLDAQTILRIIETMNGGGLPMLPRAELLKRSVELHEAFVDSGASVESWGAIGADSGALLKPSEITALAAELRKLPQVLTGKGEPNKTFAKGRDALQRAVEAKQWESVFGNALARAAITGCTYAKVDVPPAMAEIAARLGEHAGAAAVMDLAEKTQGAGLLVHGFDRAFSEVKRNGNALTFDDLPRLMLSLKAEEREWISFRMDGKVDHLLLDEFQDTSRVQYLVMEPMLTEIASGAGRASEGTRSIFAVGDIKQSLYSWRGAVPELLEGLSARLHLGEPQTRAKSWRSSQAVLDSVNQVFGSLAMNTQLAEYADVAARWGRGFQRHEAAKDLDGFATLEQVRLAEDDEDRLDLVIDRAVERVQAIGKEHPEWSIAVLTRTNGVIPRVIHRLKKVDILAAQERGHPLMDEACVSAVVSLLQLAEHPGDSASQFHVGKTVLAGIVGVTSALEPSVGMRVASEIRGRVGREGISGLVAWLRAELDGELTERAGARMEHLERIAKAFDGKAAGRIPEFIRLVQETAVIDASAGKVSVLTVHKAKGLEWDAVVLIDLERNWKGRTPAVVVDRGEAGELDPLAPVEAVSLWPGSEVQGCDPRLEALAKRWYGRGLREAMSGLYVAMTRAKQRLEMIVANEEEKRISLCSAKVLRAAVGSPAIGPEAGEIFRWEHKAAKTAAKPKQVGAAPATVECTLLFGADRRETRSAAAPSKKEILLDAGSILREPDAHAGARRRGDVWHAWMEGVEWTEEWSVPDAELMAVAAGFDSDKGSAREQIEALRASMRGPIGHALSRVRYHGRKGTLKVAREWSLAWNEEGLVKGRVDRVVVGLENGRPIWAEVLDFKTDNIRAEQIANSIEGYRSQIDAYRRAVARALRLDLKEVGGALLFVKPGVVGLVG